MYKRVNIAKTQLHV